MHHQETREKPYSFKPETSKVRYTHAHYQIVIHIRNLPKKFCVYQTQRMLSHRLQLCSVYLNISLKVYRRFFETLLPAICSSVAGVIMIFINYCDLYLLFLYLFNVKAA